MQLLYLSDLQRPSGCFSFGKSTDDGYSEFKNTHITADLAIHWNSAEVNAITVGFRSFQDAPEHHFVITLLIQIYLFLGFRLHFELRDLSSLFQRYPRIKSIRSSVQEAPNVQPLKKDRFITANRFHICHTKYHKSTIKKQANVIPSIMPRHNQATDDILTTLL